MFNFLVPSLYPGSLRTSFNAPRTLSTVARPIQHPQTRTRNKRPKSIASNSPARPLLKSANPLAKRIACRENVTRACCNGCQKPTLPRAYSTLSEGAPKSVPDNEITERSAANTLDKEFYLDLVDLYDFELPVGGEPRADRARPQSASTFLTTVNIPEPAKPRDLAEGKMIQSFRDAVYQKLPIDHVYDLYKDLPQPRVSYLDPQCLDEFIRQLAHVQRKTVQSAGMYHSIIEDMKAAEIPLSLAQWNTAIAFAGRRETIVTAAALNDALHIWREMETTSGIHGNDVTFNILYDIASRAQKFELADMVRAEMIKRSLPLDRYNLVSLIQNCGFRLDSDGVRKAYADYVFSEEIVDTRVMNTVIAALLRCGEPKAAENTFGRMKRMHGNRTHLDEARSSRFDSRMLGKALRKAASMSRGNSELLAAYQAQTSLKPDLTTFRLFMSYYCRVSGDLTRAAALVNDLNLTGYPLHGFVFLYLFKGFYIFGNRSYTEWTDVALRTIWTEWLAIVDQEETIRMDRWAIIWALRAFSRVCGERSIEPVWDDIRSRTSLNENELLDIDKILQMNWELDR
ncbi:MAG: hypothetical protein M1814_004717 [Vezdaea aestivalis]|nr:MAG: hypothetical protein M1814_004717 [Vezdaea aestivalis]